MALRRDSRLRRGSRLRPGSRLRRGPVVALLLAVGVLGSVLILASQLRPSLDVYAPVTVADAATGTTYAVDDQLCVRSASVASRLRGVEVAGGGELDLAVQLPPEGRPPVIAFPVEPGDGRPVEGAVVPAGEDLCLRLLLSSDAEGTFRAPRVEVAVRYGPFGLFRRTLDVVPPTTLEVDRSGPDPRLSDG